MAPSGRNALRKRAVRNRVKLVQLGLSKVGFGSFSTIYNSRAMGRREERIAYSRS